MIDVGNCSGPYDNPRASLNPIAWWYFMVRVALHMVIADDKDHDSRVPTVRRWSPLAEHGCSLEFECTEPGKQAKPATAD